ncbi:MAG: SCP2 sterol-binding domain-containing protein [Acidimicrobiales bacterium]
MARLYSPEWVEQFNRAVDDLDVDPAVLGKTSLVAGDRAVRVDQVLHDVPGRTDPLTVTLVVRDRRLRLEVAEPGPSEPAPDDRVPAVADVTVFLGHADAAALSRGELGPAEAIATGRIRVRGDLSVLVAVQGVLAAAAPRLADLSSEPGRPG